jgi:hypothetical protein
MANMKQRMLETVLQHAHAHVAKHKMNIEVYLENAVGVGEHSDIMDSIEKELAEMATYQDQIDIVEQYFLEDLASDM